jgi:hypothetical protein
MCQALYQRLSIAKRYGRRGRRAGHRFHGHYASFNLKDHREIVHINIEKAGDIQEQLVTKIAELAATAAEVGEAVPVRFDVPATAAAELWDSGLPVAAHERDTLEMLAASYHVPLWALAQVNPIAKNAPLGRRTVLRLDCAQSRLAKDFEATIDSARAFLYAASVMLLVRRIARAL